MNWFKSLLLICSFLCGFNLLTGQSDIKFAQPNLLPIYYNPAFAGALQRGRITASYNTQTVAVVGHPHSGYFSWDQVVDKLKGGVGVMAFYNQHAAIGRGAIGISYSPKFKFGDSWSLAPAMGVRLGMHNLDGRNLIFGSGGPDPCVEDRVVWKFYPDFQLGFLLNNPNFYFGASANHILDPDIDLTPACPNKHPSRRRSFIMESGYSYKAYPYSKWSYSVGALVGIWQVFNPAIQIRTNVKFKTWILGFGGDNLGDLNFMGGFKNDFMRLNYTYILRTSGLGVVSSGGHEMSLTYYLPAEGKEAISFRVIYNRRSHTVCIAQSVGSLGFVPLVYGT